MLCINLGREMYFVKAYFKSPKYIYNYSCSHRFRWSPISMGARVIYKSEKSIIRSNLDSIHIRKNQAVNHGFNCDLKAKTGWFDSKGFWRVVDWTGTPFSAPKQRSYFCWSFCYWRTRVVIGTISGTSPLPEGPSVNMKLLNYLYSIYHLAALSNSKNHYILKLSSRCFVFKKNVFEETNFWFPENWLCTTR